MRRKQPLIFGIVNITEDSFSDGGRYLETADSLEHGRRLHQTGADVLDLGARASNPDSEPVSPSEEIRRLAPLIAAFQKEKIPLSIDSFSGEVQRYAIENNIDYLNDIQGFPDSSIYPLIASSHCKLIVMHSIDGLEKATRREMEPREVEESVYKFFDLRLQELILAGIDPDRLILDPGMGFFLGSKPEASIHILKIVSKIKERYAMPLMVSVSRKSFLGAITGRSVDKRSVATAVAELIALSRGTDMIRTHEPSGTIDAMRISSALGAEF